jgi:hypothetical protein
MVGVEGVSETLHYDVAEGAIFGVAKVTAGQANLRCIRQRPADSDERGKAFYGPLMR